MLLTLFTSVTNATSLDFRTFLSGSTVWFVGQSSILSYATDTRAVRRMSLNDVGGVDSIADVVESDGTLWFSSSDGLFRADMATGTVEKSPLPEGASAPGKLAADMDYLWLASGSDLWRLDKLTNEWLRLERGTGATGSTFGAFSNGDQLCLAIGSGMSVFAIAEEKWSFYPIQRPASARSRFLVDNDALLIVDGSRLCRYVQESEAQFVGGLHVNDAPLGSTQLHKDMARQLNALHVQAE
jgi:ligand-binding sensor domain-containing protein